MSQRIVTIPRGNDAASKGGGEALPDRMNSKSRICGKDTYIYNRKGKLYITMGFNKDELIFRHVT
jgi:hypothetical protein